MGLHDDQLRIVDCLAGCRVLKSKCEADVYLELINLRTGQPEALPSVEIAVRTAYHGGCIGSGAVGGGACWQGPTAAPLEPLATAADPTPLAGVAARRVSGLATFSHGRSQVTPGFDNTQVSVVDGESYSEANAGNYGHVKELLKNDDVGRGSEGTGRDQEASPFGFVWQQPHNLRATGGMACTG